MSAAQRETSRLLRNQRERFDLAQSNFCESVRRPVLVHKLPVAVDYKRLQVIVRVAAFVAGRSVSHFEIDNLFLGLVDQSVAVASAGFEASAHTRRESGSTLVGVQGWMSLQNVDELVLLGMSMTQRRYRLGS